MIDEGVVEGVIGEPKTRESKRPVALTDAVREELEEYIAAEGLSGNDFLFAYATGLPMSHTFSNEDAIMSLVAAA